MNVFVNFRKYYNSELFVANHRTVDVNPGFKIMIFFETIASYIFLLKYTFVYSVLTTRYIIQILRRL